MSRGLTEEAAPQEEPATLAEVADIVFGTALYLETLEKKLDEVLTLLRAKDKV